MINACECKSHTTDWIHFSFIFSVVKCWHKLTPHIHYNLVPAHHTTSPSHIYIKPRLRHTWEPRIHTHTLQNRLHIHKVVPRVLIRTLQSCRLHTHITHISTYIQFNLVSTRTHTHNTQSTSFPCNHTTVSSPDTYNTTSSPQTGNITSSPGQARTSEYAHDNSGHQDNCISTQWPNAC